MPQPTLADLFHDQPNPVWYAVSRSNDSKDATGRPGYIIDYINTAAQQLTQHIEGDRNLTSLSTNEGVGFFANMVKSIDTGKPQQHEVVSERQSLYYEVTTTPTPGGVLIMAKNIAVQRQLEQALQQEASKFQGLLENTPDGILLLSSIRNADHDIVDFIITHCNEAGCRLGRLPADAKGRTLLQMLPHLKHDTQFYQHKHVVETGEPAHFETTFRNEAGEEFGWFMVSLQKMDDGVLSRFVDITNKKNNEEKIERQANLLKSILDSSLDSVFALEAVRDETGDIIDFIFLKINEQFTKVTGLAEEEVIGKRYLTLFNSSRNNGMFEMKRGVVANGTPVQSDICYKDHGIDAWFRLSLSRLGNNGLVQTFSNITESRKARERLRTIIDTSVAGMFTLTPVLSSTGEVVEFKFGLVNQAVADYFGKSIEVLTGAVVGDHHSAYHTNGLFNLYKSTYEHATPTQVDYHLEEGMDIYLTIRVHKAEDELLVTFTNHTPLIKLQLQLQQSVKELQRSNESLEEFTSAASHDLKEPIRKINFLVSLLKSRQPKDEAPDTFKTFEKLETATRRMIHLVDDLLEYSHLSYSEQEPEPVNLNQLIAQVLEDLELVVTEKNARVDYANLPIIFGNPLQMHQLFENLLSNSLKYSKKEVSPHVTITAALVPGSSVADERAGEGMYHEIAISDNGIGFSQEYAEQIFNVFERLHGNYEYKGSGIGLSIVRKVAENHQGFIKATSNTDEGAIFRLYLPVSK